MRPTDEEGFGSSIPTAEGDAENAQFVQWMQKVRYGDERAFRELIEATEDRVYGTIVKMLGGVEGAEDLAQRVFVRVWQARERYEPSAKFTTWLFSIVRNLVLNERRGRSRRGAVFTNIEPEGYQQETRLASSPVEDALAAELARAIDAALAKLPEDQRTAIILRRYEEMPYEEIAAVLETTLSSVKSLIFRARQTLREELAGWL